MSSSDKGKPVKKDGRIVTMDSVRRSQEEGQAYYAGSGQQIVGRDGAALAAALRRAARSEDLEERISPVGSSFSGVGRRLDEEEVQREIEASVMPNQAGASRVVLTLWKDGYNVDDGPLRSYNDDSCESLMESLARGELPNEILPSGSGTFGTPVNLTVVDNRPQTFTQTLKIFGGSGKKLGSTHSTFEERTPREETSLPLNENSTNRTLVVVECDDMELTNPITVKIRLPDGKVISIKLTPHSLVSDLRLRLIQTIPTLSETDFSLHTIYPRRVLTDQEPVQPNALFVLTI